jgi:hypothetical protein
MTLPVPPDEAGGYVAVMGVVSPETVCVMVVYGTLVAAVDGELTVGVGGTATTTVPTPPWVTGGYVTMLVPVRPVTVVVTVV